ncbi:hypothetical protein G6Z94_15835 [Vibrio aestuarianus]|uniref:hypothetical protein n=1 Tax=Vibrio aestuarianus TaxID=28171 RepID=UPI0015938FF0|nr:hypothetical protein [Vibrio aestuarianus]NGZ18792.1 hypothetical protein [Vibrio aestuarianus]
MELEEYLSKRDDVAIRYTKDRIKEYYAEYPYCGENLGHLVHGTVDVRNVNDMATVVLAVSALEVLIKEVILRPVISCLVNDKMISKFMCDAVIKQSGLDRFNRFVFWVFDSLFEVTDNVCDFKREGAKLTIWQERSYIQKVRNEVVHKGTACSKSDAELAMALLNEFELLYRNVLLCLGLTISLDEDNRYTINAIPRTIVTYKRLRQIPNAWHFSFHRWVLCLRWYG